MAMEMGIGIGIGIGRAVQSRHLLQIAPLACRSLFPTNSQPTLDTFPVEVSSP
jgi:hypothetical protein